MFEPSSRYAGLPVAELTVPGPDGEPHTVRYVTRRFVPPPAGTPLVTHVVTQGERLDTIAARYLADPTQFWRLCDANSALRPDELVETPGRVLVIAVAGIGGA